MSKDTLTAFSQADIKALEPTMKVGLLATVNPQGLPHLTLIASLQANTATQMIFGQFTEGLSKKYIRENPRAGFMIMTLDRNLWRGRATFTHTAQEGPEFEMYNNTPMFRYNAYFGVHTVYYLDLVEHSGRQALPMGWVVMSAVGTMAARMLSRKRHEAQALNLWTQGLMNKLDSLKFVTYVSDDGYPVVVPAIQAQAADAQNIVLATGAFKDDLEMIPKGATVAILGMTLDMEDVLVRGEFKGIQRMAGVRCGRVEVDWVYNSMPPKPQQIYPQVDLEAVTTF
jgi:hypothetical protein